MDIADETPNTVEKIAEKIDESIKGVDDLKQEVELANGDNHSTGDIVCVETGTVGKKYTSVVKDSDDVVAIELVSEKEQSLEAGDSSLVEATPAKDKQDLSRSEAPVLEEKDCGQTNVDLSLLGNIYSEARSFLDKWRAADTVAEVGIKVMKCIYRSVRNNEMINSSIVAHFTNALLTASVEDSANFLNLARRKSKEEFRYLHPVNVAIYSIAIGRKLEYESKRLLMLGASALFHDIGEARLPDRMILKPSQYTEVEMSAMQKHPEFGYKLIKKYTNNTPNGLLLGVLQHHERIDGSGYPSGHMDKFIHPFAKIIAVSETFDSIITDRCHAKRIGQIDALKMLYSKAGSKFDERVVNILISALGMYPVGTVLKLKTGEEAIVVLRGAEDISKPTLLVIRGFDGGEITSPYILEMYGDKDAKEIVEIVKNKEIDSERIDEYISVYSNSL